VGLGLKDNLPTVPATTGDFTELWAHARRIRSFVRSRRFRDEPN